MKKRNINLKQVALDLAMDRLIVYRSSGDGDSISDFFYLGKLSQVNQECEIEEEAVGLVYRHKSGKIPKWWKTKLFPFFYILTKAETKIVYKYYIEQINTSEIPDINSFYFT